MIMQELQAGKKKLDRRSMSDGGFASKDHALADVYWSLHRRPGKDQLSAECDLFSVLGESADSGQAGRPGALPPQAASPHTLTGGVKCDDGHFDGVVGVHWLQGTIATQHKERIQEYFSKIFGMKPQERTWGQYRYDRSMIWEPFGVSMFFDSSEDRCLTVHNNRVTVCIPGKALDQLKADVLASLIHDLCYMGWFIATRVDVFWDDFRRMISPCDIATEAEKGNFTGYRKFQHIAPKRWSNGQCVRDGDTVTFGSRGENGAGKFLRIYDKGLESKHERECIRWECEFSGERARKVVWELANIESIEAFGAVCGGLIGGAIHFVDRVSQNGKRRAHIAECKPLDWWATIISMLGQTIVRNSERFQEVDRSGIWVERSVSATLGMLHEAMGPGKFFDWLIAVVDDGRMKMGERHKRLLSVYFRENGEPTDSLKWFCSGQEISTAQRIMDYGF